MSEKKKPAAVFGPYKSGGGSQIEVAVWANEGKDEQAGRVFYNVSFSRSYYDGKDASDNDRYERTTSLRQQDIPVLIYALDRAQGWIHEKRLLDSREGRDTDSDTGEDIPY